MTRLVVIDLDGTLLNADHQIGDFTKRTIRAIYQQGVQIMIATGRHFQDVHLLAKQFEIPIGLITSNGARVHDSDGHLLYENHIPEALVQQVLELSAGFSVHRNIYQGEAWLVEEPNVPLLEIHKASGFEYQLMDFSMISGQDIDKFYFNAPHATLLPLEAVLREQLGEQLYITFTTEIYLEVMNKGVSKGTALAQLCAAQGIAQEDVMAFGDGLNDIDMLQWVGHSVVMANASPVLAKSVQAAKFAKSNAEEGVALYLQNHFLSA